MDFLFELLRILPWFVVPIVITATALWSDLGASFIAWAVQRAGLGGVPASVSEELARMRTDICEIQERIDFAERALAAHRSSMLAAGTPANASLPSDVRPAEQSG